MTRVTALSEDAQRILGRRRRGRADGGAGPAWPRSPVRTRPTIEGPLREAVAAQILAIDAHGRPDAYRFRHALLAEAVYDDLLPSERRRLHAAYAAALDARPIPSGAEGASQLASLAHHATAAHETCPWRSGHGSRAARAAAGSHAFAEAQPAPTSEPSSCGMPCPRTIGPTDADAAALYYEGALAAMISGRNRRAVDLARAAVERLDPRRELERWAAANERLARADVGLGQMDEGLAILEATAERLGALGRVADRAPGPRRDRRRATCSGATIRRRSRRRRWRSMKLARPAVTMSEGARAQHPRDEHGPERSMLGRAADPARGVRAGQGIRRRRRRWVAATPTSVPCCSICGAAEESLRVALDGVAWARTVGATGGYRPVHRRRTRSTPRSSWVDGTRRRRSSTNSSSGEPGGREPDQHASVVGPALCATRPVGRGGTPPGARARAWSTALHEAQFTGPIYVGLVELALSTGRIGDAVDDRGGRRGPFEPDDGSLLPDAN